jgi:4-hydroxybenzoate polyprenyltransferase
LKIWLKALRVHQWTKNVLIFLPMLLAHELTTPALYVKAVLAFFAFSFAASAIYVFNDLFDLHADQHHPRKKNRPFAAGNLSLLAAAGAVPSLILLSLATAQFLPVEFTGILFIYLLITTLYSWRLKQIALLDVLTLAGLYTIRILAGTAAYGVATSGWLLGFSAAIFLSLALVKRYAELREALAGTPEKIGARGRGYHARHLPWLARFGIASGVLSAVVLALYITSPKVLEFYNRPAALWLLCLLLLYWIGRIWLFAVRGRLSDDPLDFAARDPQTWIIGGLSATVLILGTVL